MAKAPKLSGIETKAGKLRVLKQHGLTDNKTFSKTAERTWKDFITEYPSGKAPKGAVFIKVSPEAKRACESVNMLSIGGFVRFPKPPGGAVKIRETKHGVFIDYGKNGNRLDTIILSKNLDHIKYGMKIAKRDYARQNARDEITHAWGTLKTHAYQTGRDTPMIKGFMRDTTVSHENPMSAVFDDRYSVDKIAAEINEVKLTDKFIDKLQQTNGVAALIRVNF